MIEPNDAAGEVWRPAPGFSNNYEVSTLGRIRSAISRRGDGILNGTVDRYGYRYVNLQTGGAPEKAKVHRLVCIAFHGPPPSGHIVCHLDGNSLNNAADNLAWGTPKDNVLQSIAHGTFHFIYGRPGDNRGPRAFSSRDHAMGQMAGRGLSQREIARHFQINQSGVCRILRRFNRPTTGEQS